MNRVRFARRIRSGEGVQSGSDKAYGRLDGVVTRDVSLVKRGVLGQVRAQPFSSESFPRPPPAPRPPPPPKLIAPRPLGAPRPPRPPPAPAAVRSARSPVMTVGSSDAK